MRDCTQGNPKLLQLWPIDGSPVLCIFKQLSSTASTDFDGKKRESWSQTPHMMSLKPKAMDATASSKWWTAEEKDPIEDLTNDLPERPGEGLHSSDGPEGRHGAPIFGISKSQLTNSRRYSNYILWSIRKMIWDTWEAYNSNPHVVFSKNHQFGTSEIASILLYIFEIIYISTDSSKPWVITLCKRTGISQWSNILLNHGAPREFQK